MQAPLNSYKKNIVSIGTFGGLNHTDFTRLGEWYELCNLSDRYAPLLTPRRSRERFATLAGQADEVLLKNGIWYYTVPGEGIYCYAPEGDNPFSEVPTTEPVCIYESERDYQLLEMGNRIICIPRDESATAISIKGGKIKELGYNEAFNYQSLSYDPMEPQQILRMDSVILNNRSSHSTQFWYKSGEATTAWFDVPDTASGSGYYNDHAGTLLNITFTYAFRRDDGSFYYLHARDRKYPPTKTDFAASRYFLGTDNKFYSFDYDSKAVSEITAPQIVILFRLGEQRQHDTDSDDPEAYTEKIFPELSEGDYIRLTVGQTINYKHPLYSTEEDILPQQLLRVAKASKVPEDNVWGLEGWTDSVVVDYNAQFIDKLIKKDLIFSSTAYNLPYTSDGTPASEAEDLGLRQLYPEYIEIESAFPVVTNCLEHNNRIWGTNNENNEIKASAQGNFETWDDYRGFVSDSYAVSVGSNDRFTASCAIDDYLFFFKEHSYTLLYGTRPANFSTNTVNDFIGIDAAGACSLQVIGKSAYYMGIDGRFYRFNGQSAGEISTALGERRYQVLSAAHSQSKYYALAEDESGQRCLLVYNTASGTWWVEDATYLEKVCNIRGRACAVSFIDSSSGTAADILLLEKWNIPQSEKNTVEWFCESGLLGLESDYYQYISNLKITFESEVGATVEVLAKYDNDTAYTPLARFVSKTKGTRTEKIAVRRCEFMRLKLVGTGFSKIYRISYLTQQGSEK